jgi:hypothetical protein
MLLRREECLWPTRYLIGRPIGWQNNGMGKHVPPAHPAAAQAPLPRVRHAIHTPHGSKLMQNLAAGGRQDCVCQDCVWRGEPGAAQVKCSTSEQVMMLRWGHTEAHPEAKPEAQLRHSIPALAAGTPADRGSARDARVQGDGSSSSCCCPCRNLLFSVLQTCTAPISWPRNLRRAAVRADHFVHALPVFGV